MLDSPFRTLTVKTEGKPEGFVTISVVDTGSGIADEIAPHLFQPFVTSKKTGMGIGLSLSRTIIEDHGGRIWADPVAAGGTAFRFTIPTVGADE